MTESDVVFDTDEFKNAYPQFANMSNQELENFFLVACQICDNTANSLVRDLVERKILLNLLVGHLAVLQQRDGAVGALQSATEGKVSVSFAVPSNPNWYQQSQYGWTYWELTLKYSTGGRYYGFSQC